MDSFVIPPKERPEWKDLVTGKIKYEFKNYGFKVFVFQLTKDVGKGKLSVEQAADELYKLCCKYEYGVKEDCINIFKNTEN